MRSITKYFIEHPTIVNLCLLLIVGVGLMQLLGTKTTNFPQQRIRFVDVTVAYPGATPEEVEEGITIKIEEELEGGEGIDRVTSTSGANLATISVEMTEDSDPEAVMAEVKNAVDKINNFPRGVEEPVVELREKKDIALAFAIVGEQPLQVKKDYADQIERELLAVAGISDIVISGVPEQEIEITVSEGQLQAYGLTFEEVRRAIANANLETFGGEIKTGRRNINIKADSKGYYAKDLQNLVVRAGRDGNVVYLKDIATLRDRFKDQPQRHYLGEDRTITLSVYTMPDEDILDNAAATRDYIVAFNAAHTGVRLEVVEDGTLQVTDRLQSMVNNGVVGFVLVLLVLALFLDRYLAFWVALKIPVAIIGMFLLVDVQGMTINVVSLFGFILVLGILVDDGVVIGENIYQWATEKGAPPLKAALEGTMEMVTPVLISLSTTAVAFSLFFFLPTQAGEFFGEIGFVVIAVLLLAIVESFFFLPAHLAHSRALRSDHTPTRIERYFNNSVNWVRDRVYLPVFRRVVVGKRSVAFLTVGLFVGGLVGAVLLFRIVGFTFFPNLDDNAVFIELDMPPGTPVDVTEARLIDIQEAARRANEKLSEGQPEGEEYIQYTEVITGPRPNQGKLRVTFLGGERRDISSFELTNAIREEAPAIPEAVNLVYGVGATTAVFGKPVSFALRGRNLEELRAARDEFKAAMQSRDDLKDVSDNDQTGIQEVIVRLRPSAELLGLNLAGVMSQVRAGFFGAEAQSIQRGDDEIEIWVRYPEAERSDEQQLRQMRITGPGGRSSYPLEEIAELDYGSGSLTINHIDGEREIRVEANVANMDVSAPTVIGELEERVLPDILAAYPSVDYSIEGQNRQSFKMAGAMATVGPIVLLFIFGLIVLNFNSFSQALMTFSLFPFAIIGVVLGHWVHATTLNLFSMIGTIALIGVFTNNSLVFVSTFNQLLEEGRDFRDALRETARSRFRPILLTTVTTVAGLAPLIASSSLGAQFLKGPAIAIAYGLSFGLLNVLLLLPVFLVILNGLRRLLHKASHRGDTPSREEVEPAVRARAARVDDYV